MLNPFLEFIKAPEFPGDEEKTRQARALNALHLNIGGAIIVLGSAGVLFFFPEKFFSSLILIIAVLVTGVGMIQNRRGQVKLAAISGLAFFWCFTVFMVVISSGIQSLDIMFFITGTVMAGIVLGAWGAYVYSGVSLLTGLVLILAANTGFEFGQIFTFPPFSAWVLLFINLAFTVTPLQVALQSLSDSARRALGNEERYRLITSVMSDYAFSNHYNTEGDITNAWTSGAFEKITGYTPQEYFSRGGWPSILHPDDREQDRQDLEQLWASQKVVSEVRIIRKDGQVRWVQVYAHPKMDEKNRRLVGIYGAVQDITERKRTETALIKSESRNRVLLEAIPDMIIELNREGLITDIIPPKGMEENMPARDIFNRQIHEMLSESAASQALFAIDRSLTTGHLNVFEFEEKMGGENRTLEARVIPSSSTTALMIVRDITQRKWVDTEREKLIHELELKNEESETLRESAAAVALSLDLDETVVRILDQLQQVVPYDSASVQLLRGNETEVVGGRGFPDGKDAIGMRFVLDETDPAYPIIRGGVPYVLYPDIQAVNQRFKGLLHDHILSWMAIPLYARGRLIGLLALDGFSVNKFTETHARFASTFANQVAVTLENSRLYAELQSELRKQVALRNAMTAITSSLHLDEVLVEICRQMSSAIDATSAYIASYDPSNSSCTIVAEYLGPDVNEMEKVSDLGMVYYEKDGIWIFGKDEKLTHKIIHSDDPDLTPWARKYLTSFGGRSILYVPLFIQGRIIGHTELWESRRKRVFSEEEISFCQAISQQAAIAIENANLFEESQRDLAIRQSLVSELETKNAELERFTYTVSHDLKSPLFTIRGFLGYLESDALAGNRERLNSDIQRITDATEKMQRLLNELLELSRVGRLRNEPVSIPFEELVREAVNLVQGRIMERGIAVHIDANMPVVFGDRPRLLEVVQNLVDNAAKFMGEQPAPRIEIGWNEDENGKPIFHVRDNGIGIPPEHHERVFGLFNKLDVKADGSGIGLTLVKRIIELQGGRIWVQSEAGKGATFFFTLPVAPTVN